MERGRRNILTALGSICNEKKQTKRTQMKKKKKTKNERIRVIQS